MIKINFFYFILFFFLITSKTFSQSIVYADLDAIIKTSDVGKLITSYFSSKNDKLIEIIKSKKKILKEKESSLISQKNILQPNEYSKKVNIIKKEIIDFNKNNKNQLDKINYEKNEVTKSFLIEINKILKEFAEKNKIDIIVSSNQILIGKSNLDVTDELLKIVNEKITKFEINK